MEQIKAFWDRLNSLIKEKGFTQNSLSEYCGFNSRRIQNLSAGNRIPDVFEAVKIAQALGTTVEYLVTGENSPPITNIKSSLLNLIHHLETEISNL